MSRKCFAVGIDLGNSNSLVTVEMNGLIQMVSADGNSRRLPSAVYMGRPRIFGETALKNETTSPQRVLHSVKRLIGRKYADPSVQEFAKSVGL